jgi:putative ABC transport system permease protein
LFQGENEYTTTAVGLPPASELYRLYSTAGDRVNISDGGILLSGSLEGILDTHEGDVIEVISAGVEEIKFYKVAGFVQQPMGAFGFIALNEAQELAGGQSIISGLMLDVRPEHLDSIREKAYTVPGVASVELTSESNDKVVELMSFIRNMMWIMLGFGAALALAIVFTTVTVNILERRREIATMRTLGQGKGRIVSMITLENLLLGLVGIIPGIPLGYLLAIYLFRLFQADIMTFYLVVYPATYLWTIALIIVILLVSQIPSIRHINRLDLARVIKEQST